MCLGGIRGHAGLRANPRAVKGKEGSRGRNRKEHRKSKRAEKAEVSGDLALSASGGRGAARPVLCVCARPPGSLLTWAQTWAKICFSSLSCGGCVFCSSKEKSNLDTYWPILALSLSLFPFLCVFFLCTLFCYLSLSLPAFLPPPLCPLLSVLLFPCSHPLQPPHSKLACMLYSPPGFLYFVFFLSPSPFHYFFLFVPFLLLSPLELLFLSFLFLTLCIFASLFIAF